jgi:hypothetical protein
VLKASDGTRVGGKGVLEFVGIGVPDPDGSVGSPGDEVVGRNAQKSNKGSMPCETLQAFTGENIPDFDGIVHRARSASISVFVIDNAIHYRRGISGWTRRMDKTRDQLTLLLVTRHGMLALSSDDIPDSHSMVVRPRDAVSTVSGECSYSLGMAFEVVNVPRVLLRGKRLE